MSVGDINYFQMAVFWLLLVIYHKTNNSEVLVILYVEVEGSWSVQLAIIYML